MEHNNIVRWGIVSTGRIAQKFCEDIKHVKNCKLVAVAARTQQAANDFSQKFHIPYAHQGYEALFNNPNVDLVYIATPHNFHFEHAKAALLAGKSVLCEKPITTSSIHCKELQSLAAEKGLFLMEAMWTYFLPSIIKAKQWVDDGRIGKIKHIKADFGYSVPFDPEGRMYNPDLAGGALLDMGVYPLAISHYFNSESLTSVNLKVQHARTGVDDDLVILAKAGDVTLSLATSFQCRLQNAALIIGTEGYIKIPDFWRAKSCKLFKLDTLVDEFIDNDDNIGYCHEAQAVSDMIINKKKEHPSMPLSTSLILQQQMELIRTLF